MEQLLKDIRDAYGAQKAKMVGDVLSVVSWKHGHTYFMISPFSHALMICVLFVCIYDILQWITCKL